MYRAVRLFSVFFLGLGVLVQGANAGPLLPSLEMIRVRNSALKDIYNESGKQIADVFRLVENLEPADSRAVQAALSKLGGLGGTLFIFTDHLDGVQVRARLKSIERYDSALKQAHEFASTAEQTLNHDQVLSVFRATAKMYAEWQKSADLTANLLDHETKREISQAAQRSNWNTINVIQEAQNSLTLPSPQGVDSGDYLELIRENKYSVYYKDLLNSYQNILKGMQDTIEYLNKALRTGSSPAAFDIEIRIPNFRVFKNGFLIGKRKYRTDETVQQHNAMIRRAFRSGVSAQTYLGALPPTTAQMKALVSKLTTTMGYFEAASYEAAKLAQEEAEFITHLKRIDREAKGGRMDVSLDLVNVVRAMGGKVGAIELAAKRLSEITGCKLPLTTSKK